MRSDAVTNKSVDTMQIRETDYFALPCSIQLLIQQHSTLVPSDTEGVLAFELPTESRLHIEQELEKCRGSYKINANAYYLNWYHCPCSGANWSSWSCDSPRHDCCPHCNREVTPVTSNAYVALRHVS